VRAFNTLRALGSCGEVTLLAIVKDQDRPLLKDCHPWCQNLVVTEIRSLWSPNRPSRWKTYWSIVRNLDPGLIRFQDLTEFRRIAQRLIGQAPDLIWISGGWLAGSTPGIEWRRVVVDCPDLDYRVMKRTMRLVPFYGSKLLCEITELWKQELFERRVYKRAARVLVCSENDRRELGYGHARVLPNCVDLPEKPTPAGSEVPYRLLFVGKMDYHPNVDAVLFFYHTIFPRIRQVEPRAHLYIVGREPPAEIRALHTGTDVVVTGTVADISPYFNSCSLVIVPLRAGGGTRVKILEAFSYGKPVVSTTLGSEGLEVRHGRDLYIADRPEEFSAGCLELMSDRGKRVALGAAGRRLVESQYSGAVFGQVVRQVVSEVMSAL
jgi:glycosyltransferase involved in cell wall biosynthesis